jgi:hypothetical protein
MFLLLANSGFISGLIYHQGIAHNSCASSAIPQDAFQRIVILFQNFLGKSMQENVSLIPSRKILALPSASSQACRCLHEITGSAPISKAKGSFLVLITATKKHS